MTEEELKKRPKTGTGSKATKTQDWGKLSDGALTYVYEKIAEVLTGQAKSQGYAFPIVWGTDHEPEAAEFFEKQVGIALGACGFFTYTDHAGGSPDRITGDEKAIAEIKCPYDSVNQIHYLMLTDHYDVRRNHFDYWVQMQCNMLFTDTLNCHFITYDPRMIDDRHKMQHLEIPADMEFRDRIVKLIELATKEKLSLLQTLQP
jgi:hypothetical protein